jgi:uncharacterized protein YbjT (DUF2867 family)
MGHEPLTASPSTGVDSLTGVGVERALRGTRVVVDVSNPRARDDQAVREFFRASSINLLAAERASGVEHHITLSVVGSTVARGSGYLAAKAAQEHIVEAGGVPYTIVRATQFFEFLDTIIDAATSGDVVRLPPAGIQPVAADDVASALTELAVGDPVDGVVELAGPELFRMDELGRHVLSARDDGRRVVTDPEAPYFGARLEPRTLVPQGPARLGGLRLDDWLGIRGESE